MFLWLCRTTKEGTHNTIILFVGGSPREKRDPECQAIVSALRQEIEALRNGLQAPPSAAVGANKTPRHCCNCFHWDPKGPWGWSDELSKGEGQWRKTSIC